MWIIRRRSPRVRASPVGSRQSETDHRGAQTDRQGHKTTLRTIRLKGGLKRNGSSGDVYLGGGRGIRGFVVGMRVLLLSQEDSNLYKQNQNLLCYHYTMRQAPWSFF